MYKYLLFFYCCCFAFFTQAQNLLLNGDFEEYWDCPDNLGKVNNLKYVFNPCHSTSDFFHSCYPPNDYIGKAFSNQGQCGIILTEIKNYTSTEWREYLQLKLSRNLRNSEKITFTFFIRTCDVGGHTNYISYDNIGVAFVEDSVVYSDYLWKEMKADWNNSTNVSLSDTNWIPLNGEYIAKGGEEWMIIGNFSPDYYTEYVIIDSNRLALSDGYTQKYVCIDGVKILYKVLLPNVFTPNNDNINDMWIVTLNSLENELEIHSIVVYNRWGKIVYEEGKDFIGWDGYCNEQPCSDGVYFAMVIVKNIRNNSIEKYSGTITLLR